MSDDPSRPASGPQSDPYPVANAPEWWGALGRRDLPLDSVAMGEGRSGSESPKTPPHVTPTPSRLGRAPQRAPVQWRTWAFNAAVLLVALLIICVGVGVVSPSMFLTVFLIFGVPLTLAAVTVAIVARRSQS